jgi:hypothetical protein
MNSQELPQDQSFDAYHSFGSAPRFRPQGHYQGAFYFIQFLYNRFLLHRSLSDIQSSNAPTRRLVLLNYAIC